MFNVKEFSVAISGGNVDVVSFGKGDNILVMLPGLNLFGIKGASLSLTLFYRVFYKKYKVYIIDRTHPIDSNCSIESMANDVVEVLKSLNLENINLVGISQGGMIAQSIAINYPSLVSRLVLGVTLSRVNVTLKQTIERWKKIVFEEGLSSTMSDYIENAYSKKSKKKYKLLIPFIMKLKKKHLNIERFLKLANACLTCNNYHQLDKIKCPVFVIGGGKDQIVSKEGSIEIIEKLNCKYYIYDDLGHEAYNEAKDFNQKIYNFLNQ